MKFQMQICITFVLILLSCHSNVSDDKRIGTEHSKVFRLDKPADNRNETISVGYGRLGGLVLGGTSQERIQTNDDTFRSGEPRDLQKLKSHKYMPEIRELDMNRGYEEGYGMRIKGRLLVKQSGGKTSPVGNRLEVNGASEVTLLYVDATSSTGSTKTHLWRLFCCQVWRGNETDCLES